MADIRNKLYPQEENFFKNNPKVSGMAADDDKVILNPFSKLSLEEKQAVIQNENLRIFMRQNNVIPQVKITPEQKKFFNKTPYQNNEDAIKQTVIARFLSGDPSIQYTKEQKNEATRISTLATNPILNLLDMLFRGISQKR